jgi:hypothetical protein
MKNLNLQTLIRKQTFIFFNGGHYGDLPGNKKRWNNENCVNIPYLR